MYSHREWKRKRECVHFSDACLQCTLIPIFEWQNILLRKVYNFVYTNYAHDGFRWFWAIQQRVRDDGGFMHKQSISTVSKKAVPHIWYIEWHQIIQNARWIAAALSQLAKVYSWYLIHWLRVVVHLYVIRTMPMENMNQLMNRAQNAWYILI